MEINYSIIIPHKNIPDLLWRCLDSIPCRDDIQIIVIDDNSDTNIVDFNRFPGLCDSRVEVIFDKNEAGRKGAGYARNLGLKRARGKWLIFADADDFFNAPFFEEALNKYRDHDAHMICFSTNAAKSEDISVRLPNVQWSMGYKIEEALAKANIDIIRYTAGIVWGRFVKHDLVMRSNARFSETVVRNDALFAVMVGSVAKTIILDCGLEIYCYTHRKGSLCSRNSPADSEERYFVSKEIMKYLRRQRNKTGYSIFNRDLIECWVEILWRNRYKFFQKIPSILFLSTWSTRKKIIKKGLSIVSTAVKKKAKLFLTQSAETR